LEEKKVAHPLLERQWLKQGFKAVGLLRSAMACLLLDASWPGAQSLSLSRRLGNEYATRLCP
jgi:hypothetical protein